LGSSILKPIASWAFLTIAYGIALGVFGNFEIVSLFYHIGLLAITLYFARTSEALGLRRGNVYYGVAICLAFFGIVFTRAMFLTKPSYNFGLNLETFTLVFFAPVTEELFWRGFILRTWLADSRFDVIQAVTANALFFVLMHLPRAFYFADGAYYLMSLIPFGFLFAISYYVSRSVYYPTIMHIIQNVFSA
jgi:membrane protease YdiL (CAAX protease family)